MARRLNHGGTAEAYNQYVGNIVKVQEKAGKKDEVKLKQNDKIK